MKLTQTVALTDVKCFALHGFYPEEQLIGNHFIVDLKVVFDTDIFDDDLNKTINYEVLNAVIKQEMSKTQKLLETVLHNIILEIKTNFPFVNSITASIKKLNPPMIGQIGASFVQLEYKK